MHLGMWEIVGILLVVLLLFGPSKLPQLGSSLGSAIRNFKKGFNEGSETPDGTHPAPPPAQLSGTAQPKDVGAASTPNVVQKNG
jgi:TatA/E family protein of Tat protein translocase